MLRRLRITGIPIMTEKIGRVIIGEIATLGVPGMLAIPLKLFLILCCD